MNLDEGFEHLSHESFARPISHGDSVSGTADSQQLACHEFWPRSKHNSDEAGYDVEAGVFKRERFGFCVSFDVFAGGFLAMLLMRRSGFASKV
jgi:hypothetical protein